MKPGTTFVCALAALLVGAASGGACHDDGVTLAVGHRPDGGAGGAADTADGGVAGSDAAARWIDHTPCVVPAGSPDYRLSPMVTFDSDRRKVIVYGGQSSLNQTMTDLWELDVATAVWTLRTTCGATQPPPTASGQMVYDRARRRVIMFSGKAGKVWEWDPAGPDWTTRPLDPGAAAPVSDPVAAVYDDARGKTLVFTDAWRVEGGVIIGSLSLWEWDGAAGTWLERVDDGLPWSSSLDAPAMAFDPGGGALWLFGGWTPLDDRLWRFDPSSATLTDMTPVPRPPGWPPGRGYAGFAPDRARGRLVLLGGYRNDFQRDLWELDPATATWTNRTPVNVPVTGSALPDGVIWPAGEPGSGLFADAASGQVLRLGRFPAPDGGPALWAWDGAAGRWSARMPPANLKWPIGSGALLPAWDSDRGQLLVYLSSVRQLWRWRPGNETWELLTPAGVQTDGSMPPDSIPWPSQRSGSAIAYDPGAHRAVIFGGDASGAQQGVVGDLWIWDPATGQMSNPPRPAAGWPAPRRDHALAYDPVRRRVLLFGGAVPEASDELWALDTGAAAWERIGPGADWPPARSRHALVLDEDRQVLILQGGVPASGSITTLGGGFFDTWELPAGGSSWRQPAPGAASLRWPSALAPPYMAFVRGVGVVGLGPLGDDLTGDVALWRWDPGAAAWVAAGIDLPRSLPLIGDGQRSEIVGIGDALLALLPASPARPAQDSNAAETWEWHR